MVSYPKDLPETPEGTVHVAPRPFADLFPLPPQPNGRTMSPNTHRSPTQPLAGDERPAEHSSAVSRQQGRGSVPGEPPGRLPGLPIALRAALLALRAARVRSEPRAQESSAHGVILSNKTGNRNVK